MSLTLASVVGAGLPVSRDLGSPAEKERAQRLFGESPGAFVVDGAEIAERGYAVERASDSPAASALTDRGPAAG